MKISAKAKTSLKLALALFAFTSSLASAQAADSLFDWDDLKALKIYHAYSASDGRTYVEEISIPASEVTNGTGKAQMYFDLTPQKVKIGRSKSGAMYDWHYAYDSRHLIIPLQGDIVFDIGDGKLFHLHPGEAILAEDWTGKGHRSGCLSATKPTCVGIDMLLEPNPHAIPLRAPPVK
jgi:hypothetical protein